MEVDLANAEATDAQKLFLKMDGTTVSGTESFMVRSYGTAVENSKHNRFLVVTAEWSAADVTLNLVREFAYSDII
jgi:hypothetical protein